jgi:hypothetical protein
VSGLLENNSVLCERKFGIICALWGEVSCEGEGWKLSVGVRNEEIVSSYKSAFQSRALLETSSEMGSVEYIREQESK